MFSIGSGLQYLHSLFTSHNDVKLENVLVTSSGRVALADAGLATSLDHRMNGGTDGAPTPAVRGTAPYTAPERLGCLSVLPSKRAAAVVMAPGFLVSATDDTSDMWSLGLLAVELATGHRLHEEWNCDENCTVFGWFFRDGFVDSRIQDLVRWCLRPAPCCSEAMASGPRADGVGSAGPITGVRPNPAAACNKMRTVFGQALLGEPHSPLPHNVMVLCFYQMPGGNIRGDDYNYNDIEYVVTRGTAQASPLPSLPPSPLPAGAPRSSCSSCSHSCSCSSSSSSSDSEQEVPVAVTPGEL